MRLVWIIGALALTAGVADARVLGIGHKSAKLAKSGDERICTTTTTVVRRGDTVLSTTSSTHCEDDHGQAPSEKDVVVQGTAPPGAAASAQPLQSSQSLAKQLFGLGTPGLKPRDVLGEWSVVEPGATYACTVRMTRETFKGGYRVFTSGCRGPLGGAVAWKFEQTVAGLYAPDGSSVAKLNGDRQHLSGQTSDGGTVSLSR